MKTFLAPENQPDKKKTGAISNRQKLAGRFKGRQNPPVTQMGQGTQLKFEQRQKPMDKQTLNGHRAGSYLAARIAPRLKRPTASEKRAGRERSPDGQTRPKRPFAVACRFVPHAWRFGSGGPLLNAVNRQSAFPEGIPKRRPLLRGQGVIY